MATQALTHIDMEPSRGMLRVVGIYSGLPDLPLRETQTATAKPRDGMAFAAAGLDCVKGAMMALGIEAAAAIVALFLYGVWRH
ncbi:MAG: hypothetical protein ABSF23_15915 [Terracidiphilus sp.]|jgi:hypothetical protein